MLKSSSIKGRVKRAQRVSSIPTNIPTSIAGRHHVQRIASDPDAGCEIKASKLSVSRGGAIYEKAKSRGERNRSALMRNTSVSRDQAIPLKRGGARGPGSAVFHKADIDGAEEQMEEKGRLRMLKIAQSMKRQGLHPLNQMLPSERRARASKVGKAKRCPQNKGGLRSRFAGTYTIKAAPSKFSTKPSSAPFRSSSTGSASAFTNKPRASFTTRRPSSHRIETARLERSCSAGSASKGTKKPRLPPPTTTQHHHPSYQDDSYQEPNHLHVPPAQESAPPAQGPPQALPTAHGTSAAVDDGSNSHTAAIPNVIDLTSSDPFVIDLSVD